MFACLYPFPLEHVGFRRWKYCLPAPYHLLFFLAEHPESWLECCHSAKANLINTDLNYLHKLLTVCINDIRMKNSSLVGE